MKTIFTKNDFLFVDVKTVFSSHDSWKGATIEHINCSPGRVVGQELENHTVVFNLGADTSMEWKASSGISSAIVATGDVIAFIPAGSGFDLSWRGDLDALVISIDPVVSDLLLNAQRFRFQEKFNFNDPFLKDLASSLHEAGKANFFSEKVYAESLLTTAVTYLARQYPARESASTKGKLSPQQLKTVIEFIHSYMQFDIGLEKLASLVHLSPYHFGRLFKHTVGLSPYQYVLHLKIDYAKKLIKQNRGPIGDIAYQLNFSDQAHFSNAFRKATGISPREFLYS